MRTWDINAEMAPLRFSLLRPHLNPGVGVSLRDTGDRWRGCFVILSSVPGVWLQTPRWGVRKGIDTSTNHQHYIFHSAASLHLYLHLVSKWSQLIKLQFHTICYVSQTLVLQKGWKKSFKATETFWTVSSSAGYRLNLRESLDILKGKLSINVRAGLPSSLDVDGEGFCSVEVCFGRKVLIWSPVDLVSITYGLIWGFCWI